MAGTMQVDDEYQIGYYLTSISLIAVRPHHLFSYGRRDMKYANSYIIDGQGCYADKCVDKQEFFAYWMAVTECFGIRCWQMVPPHFVHLLMVL